MVNHADVTRAARVTKRRKKALELDLDMVEGLPAEEATRRIMKAWRVGELGKRVACFYLADVADQDGWEHLHHPSLEHWARHRLGKAVSTVRNYVRAGRALSELPVIDGRFFADELCFSVVERLSTVAVPGTDPLWAAWALGKTFEEVKEKVAQHEKGDKPTDPARRRIHTVKRKVVGKMSTTQQVVWEQYRAKVEAESGRRPNDLELMLTGANLHLTLEADGTLPGWKKVRSSCYTIHASPLPEGGPDDLLVRDMNGEVKRISWCELALAAFERAEQSASAEPWPEQAFRPGDTSLLDPDNDGEEVPEELRDVETSDALRKRVLDRDGHCCVICGSRQNLSAHHVHWRSYGGRTVLSNLVTACEACHSMIHARLLVVLIDFRRGLRCYAPSGKLLEKRPEDPVEQPTIERAEPAQEEGSQPSMARQRVERHLAEPPAGVVPIIGAPIAARPVAAGSIAAQPGAEQAVAAHAVAEQSVAAHSIAEQQVAEQSVAAHSIAEQQVAEQPVAEQPVTEQPGAAARRRSPGQIVDLARLPWEIDMAWLQRHMGLFAWNERQRVLELTPGFGRAVPVGESPAGAPVQVRLGDVVGQDVVRQNLLCAVESAKQRARQLDHLLFAGAPGLGKTLLAEAVAGELGTSLTRLSGPLVSSPEVLIRALLSLPDGGVLFVDELQGLPERMAELLYEALDTGALSLPVREVSRDGEARSVTGSRGLEQRVVRVRLRRFTLIGATTDEDEVPAALRSRLLRERLEHYDHAELAAILVRAASAEGFALEPAAAERLARASRATPRAALQLLKSVRDEVATSQVVVADGVERPTADGDERPTADGVERPTADGDERPAADGDERPAADGDERPAADGDDRPAADGDDRPAADVPVVERALARRGIDRHGYGPLDRHYLRFVGASGPVSQSAIACELGLSRGELDELCERFLRREGCVKTTPRGRVLTVKGQAELRRSSAEGGQAELRRVLVGQAGMN